MKRNYIGPLIFTIIVFLGTCVAIAGIYYLYSLRDPNIPRNADSQPPTVNIIQPRDTRGLTLASGQGLIVIAEGQAEGGVQRIEFLVDDMLVDQYIAATPGQSPQQSSFLWISSGIGVRQISVIAPEPITNGAFEQLMGKAILAPGQNMHHSMYLREPILSVIAVEIYYFLRR